jgi:predicted DNA-binding transcriptional regulator YafY
MRIELVLISRNVLNHRGTPMYHPTTRVLTVLELLQTRRQVSGPELADRLEVDVRTVRRYVTMLQELGIPVEATPGRGGGYRLRPGYKLPPLMFTDDEALALTLGLQVTRRLGLASAAPAVEGALAKLERVLPEQLRGRVSAVQRTLAIAIPPSDVTANPALVTAISAAAEERRRVTLRYRSGKREETERVIDPYGLVYLGRRWYVAGYCHLRQDLRVFRLDRISACEPASGSFERPAAFDGVAFVERALATVPDIWSIEVLLYTTIEEAQSIVPATHATLEPCPEGVILRCSRNDLDATASFLVGLGIPFRVHRPDDLRAALLRLAARIERTARAAEPAHVA